MLNYKFSHESTRHLSRWYQAVAGICIGSRPTSVLKSVMIGGSLMQRCQSLMCIRAKRNLVGKKRYNIYSRLCDRYDKQKNNKISSILREKGQSSAFLNSDNLKSLETLKIVQKKYYFTHLCISMHRALIKKTGPSV